MQHSDSLAATPPRTRSWLAPWLAWSCWAAVVAQVGFSLLLAALNQLSARRFFAEYIVAQGLGALSFATVGLLIGLRRPEHTIGRLFCAIAIGLGFTAWIGQYTRYAMVTRPGALPAGELVAWLFFWSWIPIVMLTVVFLPLLFPDGRLPSPRWRPVAWLAAVATLLLATDLALAPGPLDASMPEVSNPFSPAWSAPIRLVTSALGVPLVLLSMACAVAAQVARFRRSRGDERQQVKWFAAAAVLLIAAFVVPAALVFPDFTEDTLLSGVALAVAYPLLPAAVGVAVLRYRLYEIDLLFNRALVYGALTLCIAAIYVLVVGVAGALLRSVASLPLSLLAAGLVALAFQPLRAWLQRGVNRLLYGERDEPYVVLARLGQRLRATIEPGEVLPSLLATVRDALRLPYAAVALRRDERLEIAASAGEPVGEPLTLPLTFQGEPVGALIVSPRAAGEPWSPADRRLLADLADHAGVAVHGVRVMAELQRAREQLVLGREEERRRLRNDLHDGVAPSLAALALTAATVGELLKRDPAAAAEVNRKLQGAIRATVGDVRRLVYDLRPATLDELGLVEAIREQAALLATGGGPQVRIDVPAELPALPAAIEVAAFRITQEALANVLRHAGAQRCSLRVACSAGRAIEIEVLDDGVGLPDERRAGVGLRSMGERAAELGGVCVIGPAAPRGTRVAVWLPIGAGHEPEREGGHGSASRAAR